MLSSCTQISCGLDKERPCAYLIHNVPWSHWRVISSTNFGLYLYLCVPGSLLSVSRLTPSHDSSGVLSSSWAHVRWPENDACYESSWGKLKQHWQANSPLYARPFTPQTDPRVCCRTSLRAYACRLSKPRYSANTRRRRTSGPLPVLSSAPPRARQ